MSFHNYWQCLLTRTYLSLVSNEPKVKGYGISYVNVNSVSPPPKKNNAAGAQNSEIYFNPAYKIKAMKLSNRDKYNPEKDNISKNKSSIKAVRES